MTRNRQKDTLTRDVLEQLIGDPNDDGMPVILAKRLDPQIPTTYNLTDYGFEGLKETSRNGHTAWEVDHNFVLYIDGETGNCRIPDTEKNRQRLSRLSKQKIEIVKRIIFDEGSGERKEVDEQVTILPTYQLLEQNLAQSALLDSVVKRVIEQLGAGAEPLKKGRKGLAKDDDLLDPIK